MDAPVEGSLQDYVLGEIKERSRETQKMAIPRLPRLVIRYGPIESRDLLRLGAGVSGVDDVDDILTTGADALVKACEGTETDRGEDLGKKLGRELAEYLGIAPPDGEWTGEADREAVFLIFDDDLALMKHVNELRQMRELAAERVEGELAGN
jgi:hypothetical protein